MLKSNLQFLGKSLLQLEFLNLELLTRSKLVEGEAIPRESIDLVLEGFLVKAIGLKIFHLNIL